jgi:hypothetical protein
MKVENITTYDTNGKTHGFGDEPARIFTSEKLWISKNKIHRDHKPAAIGDNFKEWHHNGKIHRTNGPAIIYVDGICEWWLNSIRYGATYDPDGPPPKPYLKELAAMGIEFVRGSDEV